MIKPFPKQQILYSSKLKDFADDSFKFDENGRNFSKKVENAVEKGEIAQTTILNLMKMEESSPKRKKTL